MLTGKELTEQIIGAAIEAHRNLVPGLLESTYKECSAYELSLRNIRFEKEKPLPVEYKGIHLDYGYRLDFLVEDQVVVELKTVESLLPVHEAQLLTYMKLSGCKIGLLVNFNVALLKQGLKRMVL